MSETAGTSRGVESGTAIRTATETGAPAVRTAHDTVHESYAFACMRCAHSWEQSYEIEHHVDHEGRPFVTYHTDGDRVPSPLTRPTCPNCGEHLVRIMRSGQVSQIADALHLASRTTVSPASPAGPFMSGGIPVGNEQRRAPREPRHWHLSDLLHPFHRK
ncbi:MULTISPECIES: hypothetical protein [Streptomyces]|uniref:hypothetical protein n=1 Tax=Streptomyces TaxID=1883 RepID=UPI001C8D54DE|nr:MULTISPECIES: hypothetical protein [Streptomyces]UBI38440.1 hypothetical protein K7I03_19570 [Streptomyces mobaraensis]UKW31025.1 hypothetical protein MCU78_19525 [Streptomyces sp. TYQ1024]